MVAVILAYMMILHLVVFLVFVPGFCSIMICATLNASGTCFSPRHALNRYVNMTTPFLDNSLSTAGEILSMPGAFFGLMFVSISSAISIGVNSLVGSLGRRLITGLISDWMSFGVKTAARCWANSSAFSWSLRIHCPF